MHFITGGAFNGKSEWVRKLYPSQKCYWYNGYNQLSFNDIRLNVQGTIVVNGLEFFLQPISQEEQGRILFSEYVAKWKQWEREGNGTFIVIGSDMTKGVVPMNKEDRVWRDFVGWCYQDLVQQSNRVDVIWYGISNLIKQEEE
ncbi:bifunctional adenosylcobinamide kinase/adenosylcobinamide-phosphate guanylyltransferase [Bacillus alkalicellulosilyticus]|uniref:bifunctional adenosylcobinamide kinase/adenosylcobinamide-phosphate guanylyltransferase n=1 Tax=Alkalihalobacterium alkalicellulosilyticum TaxID=1912214 RepID=UPI000997F09E|nr:bifunctional adenosylcobinamide kinase/adenosylcobinamide-phosphate guanylyltransferase [Bacillus alkalicellulosilyticus]